MSSECSQMDMSAIEASVDIPRLTEVSAALQVIWQELLRVSHIEPDDDFFDLGGDSLAAIRMLERIGRAFGEELLEPDIIYTTSQFAELALALTSALAERESDLV